MEKGHDGASMSDIAQATGIKKASLYAHFSGKEEIFSAVFSDVLQDYREAISALTKKRADESALTRLERMFRGFLRYCYQNTKVYFWDRYFYYPPEFIRARMEEEPSHAGRVSKRDPQRDGRRHGTRRNPQPTTREAAALAYYYLMIGLSMYRQALYPRAALEEDISLAWSGLAQGLRPMTQEESSKWKKKIRQKRSSRQSVGVWLLGHRRSVHAVWPTGRLGTCGRRGVHPRHPPRGGSRRYTL